MKSSQSRKYLVTINNPQDKGYDHQTLADILAALKTDYYCLADEIGANGTPHSHVFLFRKSPIRFDTILKKFPGAHIDSAYGSCQENRDYVRKDGKWANDAKADSSVPGSFAEWGTLPDERVENVPATLELIASLDEGKSTSAIIRDNPALAFKAADIGVLRETLLADRYLNEKREVEVHYLYGPTGTGKTRSVFERHPAEDICRITSYQANGVRFDAYHGQPVLVFEEFNSQVPISEMLNYLDRYPLYLPARYNDRIACYSRVYITSNLPLEAQYCSVQFGTPAVWNAFLRRINKVVEFMGMGMTIEHPVAKYLK